MNKKEIKRKRKLEYAILEDLQDFFLDHGEHIYFHNLDPDDLTVYLAPISRSGRPLFFIDEIGIISSCGKEPIAYLSDPEYREKVLTHFRKSKRKKK